MHSDEEKVLWAALAARPNKLVVPMLLFLLETATRTGSDVGRLMLDKTMRMTTACRPVKATSVEPATR
jgi:hypothetical protein